MNNGHIYPGIEQISSMENTNKIVPKKMENIKGFHSKQLLRDDPNVTFWKYWLSSVRDNTHVFGFFNIWLRRGDQAPTW